MLDVRLIRAEPERVKAELAKVGFPAAEVDALLDADRRRREALHALETLRAERTNASKAIRDLKDAAERERAIAAQRTLGERIGAAEEAAAAAEADFERRMLEVPNLPHPDVPVGPDESANVVVRTVGEPRRFDFPALPHWDLGPQLGLIDFERGVKISGSRFYVLRGAGARLQRALITWMLDLHTREHGYVEVYPPAMVKRECLVGTGNLPKFGDNLYRDAEEDLWFVPTAEVPVTNLYRDEVLEAERLPIRHVAYTPCFRREKMSAGRDVRGIKRGHQFDKVELVKFVRPETSDTELAGLLEEARRPSAHDALGGEHIVERRVFDVHLGYEDALDAHPVAGLRLHGVHGANQQAPPLAVGHLEQCPVRQELHPRDPPDDLDPVLVVFVRACVDARDRRRAAREREHQRDDEQAGAEPHGGCGPVARDLWKSKARPAA